ncbi:MAG: pyruvate kinase, partial [Magnetospirillum sp.]|nr:pyruvate kinase [Magnetospirillum sp.]
IRAGVDVFRLNFSHGSHESHGASIGLHRVFGLPQGVAWRLGLSGGAIFMALAGAVIR